MNLKNKRKFTLLFHMFMLFSCLMNSRVFAKDKFINESKTVSVPGIYFTANDMSVYSATTTANFEKFWSKISKSPYLTWGMPTNWSIYFDSQWTISSGFTPLKQRDHDNRAFVILNPKSFMSDNSGHLLVHEMAHIIHNRYRPMEEGWVKEGLAQLISYLVTNTYSVSYTNSYYSHGQSLVALEHGSDKHQMANSAQYGQIFMYFYYVYKLCGGNDLLYELMTSNSRSKGIVFLERQLRKFSQHKICSSFNNSYIDFQVARFLNDPAQHHTFVFSAHRKFNIPLKATKTKEQMLPYSTIPYQPNNESHCHNNDLRLSNNICLKIRLL